MAKNQYDDLTDKQKKFTEAYFELSNGTKAALQAGYAESGAHVTASLLLKNNKVRDYLETLQKERRERVINRLAGMAEDSAALLWELAQSSDSDSVRLQAIKDIMDRSGYKPTDKVENKTEHGGKIEFGFIDPNAPE